MVERVYEIDGTERLKLDTVLRADPYGDVSFSKQGFKLKEGPAVGGASGKLYLYVTGDDAFFKYAEAKMAELGVASAKKCEAGLEAKIIVQLHAEDASAEQGFGAIFG